MASRRRQPERWVPPARRGPLLSGAQRRPALGHVELLVTLSCAASLSLLCLVLAAQAGQNQQRARCLSNLKRIAVAAMTYAIEDRREQVIPIHPRMLDHSPTWYWKTVHAFAYGGDSATQKLPFDAQTGVFLNDRAGQGGDTSGAAYARATRPLNRYALDGTGPEDADVALTVFRCPADSGYPVTLAFAHAPPAAAAIDCFDMLGNSYRANLHALYRDNGEALSLGPWGLGLSRIPAPASTVTFFDPLVLEFTAPPAAAAPPDSDAPHSRPTADAPKGWHNQRRGDPAAFVDGHVELLKDMQPQPPPADATAKLARANAGLLLRGDRWVFDAFPSPATAILGDWSGAAGGLAAWPDLQPDQWPIAGARPLAPRIP